MSEIDCFKVQILDKVNQLLKKHRCNLTVRGLKPMFNASMVFEDRQKILRPPKSIEDRIRWSVDTKKKNGARLCVKCQKVWDQSETCGLCRLTV